MGARACSPTATRSLCSASASGRCRTGRMRERGSLGARARLPPHRHRAGLRQRGERRPRAARQRRAARGGLHHHEVLSRRARTRRPRRSGASNGWASITWTSTSSTGRRAGRPGPGPGWKRARERGYARSIGVSNFSVSELDELMSVAATAPVVNQVQFSPFKYRRRLLEACERARRGARGLQPAGHRPASLGRARARDRGARRTDAGPGAPALVRAARSRGIPKSTHRDRIEENAQIFDFALPDEDMAALDALDQTGGTEAALERHWW